MSKKYYIHPAVGIARVGDSEDELYIAPEVPGTFHAPEEIYKVFIQSNGTSGDAEIHSITPIKPPDYNYRDTSKDKKIRRQAARFKIFEYDPVIEEAKADETYARYAQDHDIKEVSLEDFTITWKVQLGNLKSTMAINEPEEISLTCSGEKELIKLIQPAKIQHEGQDVLLPALGEIYTDTVGRLIVAGGKGEILRLSGSEEISDDFKTTLDGWFDDMSDGQVHATLTHIDTGEVIEAEPAWVVVAPPKFGGNVIPLVSLYDLMEENSGLEVSQYASYAEHIFPLLQKTILMQWVSKQALLGHGNDTSIFDFQKKLTEGSAEQQKHIRAGILAAIENNNTRFTDGQVPIVTGMPKLASNPAPGPFLTKKQIAEFKDWAVSEVPSPVPETLPRPKISEHTYLENLPVPLQPQALDKAHMETISTRGYKPGVDVGSVVENITWQDGTNIVPRALPDGVLFAPGAMTQELAVPWQIDIAHCGEVWWPMSYPTQVFRKDSTSQTEYIQSVTDFHDDTGDSVKRKTAREEVVAKWNKLGFVKREDYIHQSPSATANELNKHECVEEVIEEASEGGTEENGDE